MNTEAMMSSPTEATEPYRDTYGAIAFEGLRNTRDLGGLPAGERHILPRLLLRSGMLAPATDADLTRLGEVYDVRLVIDLRTDVEADRWPDPIEALPNASLVRLPVFQMPDTHDEKVLSKLAELSRDLSAGTEDISSFFLGLYPHIVLGADGIAAYRGLFQALLSLDEGAALWHCSAGKDRCGMASVLVETALGVPWHLVEKDYLATNTLLEARSDAKSPFDVGGVDMRYLRAALDAIEEAYGSLEGYLTEALGLDGEARAELRARFTA